MTDGTGYFPSMPWTVQRARCFTWAEKLALIVLWGHADATGAAWPSVPLLASEMPVNVKTARAALAGLVAKGAISEHREHGKPTRYIIVPADVLALCLTPTVSGSTPLPSKVVPETVALPDTDSDPYLKRTEPLPKTDLTPTVSGRRSITIKKNQEEEPEKKNQTRAVKVSGPAVSVAFRERMRIKYLETLGAETTAFQIDLCLGYKTTKNHANTELAVQNWLNREVDRIPRGGNNAAFGRTPTAARNGTGPDSAGGHGPGDAPAPAAPAKGLAAYKNST